VVWWLCWSIEVREAWIRTRKRNARLERNELAVCLFVEGGEELGVKKGWERRGRRKKKFGKALFMERLLERSTQGSRCEKDPTVGLAITWRDLWRLLIGAFL